MAKLEVSPFLGRVIRSEDLKAQGVSTFEHLRTAIANGQKTEGSELAAYWLTEFSLSYNYYQAWIPNLSAYLTEKQGAVSSEQNSLMALKVLIGEGEDETFATRKWSEINEQISALKDLIAADSKSDALDLTEQIRKKYLTLHDVQVAWSYLVLTGIGRELGENHLEAAIRQSLKPWIEERYKRFLHPLGGWESVVKEFLMIVAESMRCHLSGPRRWGEFKIEEEEDRWVLTFDPCGSGCSAMRGSEVFPALTDPPYSAGFTQKPYEWTWSRAGISYYCAHCCLLTEIMPIEACGYPLKITDAPKQPSDPCVWYVYKNRQSIPKLYFERVGKSKPEERATS